MSSVKIMGIGSPFGDDQAGWGVIEALEKSPLWNGFPNGMVSTRQCDRPGNRLLDDLRGAGVAIVIDAVQSGSEPGTVHRWDPRVIASGDPALLSSHGFGLASALALGEALGDLPNEVIMYGIEIADPVAAAPFEALSETVASAVEQLAAIVASEVLRRVSTIPNGHLPNPNHAFG